MIEGRLILNDLHGCLWKKNEGAPLYTREGLTNYAVDLLLPGSRSLEEIKPWRIMLPVAAYSPLQMPGEGWGLLSKTLNFYADTVAELRLHYRQNIPFAEEWYKKLNSKITEGMDWLKYFKPFQIDEQERLGLWDLTHHGDYVTVCSALPASEREIFMSRMSGDQIWDNLGGEGCPPAVLRESEEYAAIFYKAVAYRVFNEVAEILDRQLVGIDDDYHIALCLSYLYNIEVHLPMSEEEAKKQSQLPIPSNLQRHSTNGLLVFNSGLQQMVLADRAKRQRLIIP